MCHGLFYTHNTTLLHYILTFELGLNLQIHSYNSNTMLNKKQLAFVYLYISIIGGCMLHEARKEKAFVMVAVMLLPYAMFKL